MAALLSPWSVLPATEMPSQENSAEGMETKKQASKLPPCPASESERSQVSPFYFNLCAGVHLPKSDASQEVGGKVAIPPRPDYIPKELPSCPTWNPNSLASPYYPCPGQKLGLPKDEAAAALPPEIRELLDNLLKMYREPGLFTDRRKVLALLGIKQVSRHWASRSTNMPAE